MNDSNAALKLGEALGQALKAINVNIALVIDEMSGSDPELAARISARLHRVMEANSNLTETALNQHSALIELLEQTTDKG